MDIGAMIINSKKVKYVVMDELIKKLPVNTEEINLFISIDSLLKSFYNPQVNEKINVLDSDDQYMLSSEIINIAAHYRHYFWSRYQIPTNYFFYYSDKEADYCVRELPTYKSSFYGKRLYNKVEFRNLNKMIYENLKLSSLLSEYLPNIYIINTKTLEPSVLPYYIISKNGNSNDGLLNLILTNERMEYQLANLDNTYILQMESDNSKIIGKNDLINEVLLKKNKAKSTLDSNFYTTMLAISGVPNRDIVGIKGYGPSKANNKLNKLISNEEIMNNEISAKLNLIYDKITDDKSLQSLILKNYKVISIENLYKNITPKEFHNIDNQLRNKSDNMSLMEINDKYYQYYPLMLIELMEGE